MNTGPRHRARDGGGREEADQRLLPREGGKRGAEPAEGGRAWGRGKRHRPEPPPPHRDTRVGSSHRPGAHLGTPAAPQRTPSLRAAGPDEPPKRTSADRTHQPAEATTAKPLSLSSRGYFPPARSLQTPRKMTRHGRGGRDALQTTASPACQAALSPRLPGDRPRHVRARLPPVRGVRQHGRGPAGRGEREIRATGGRGGGTTRQNEGRRRQERPQRPLAEGAFTREPGEPSGGDRAREVNRRESHCTQLPGAVPPHLRHRADPKPTDPAGSPRRRQRERGPMPTPVPANEDPRAAAGPNVRRRAGRGPTAGPPKESAPESEVNPAIHGPSRAPRRGGGLPRFHQPWDRCRGRGGEATTAQAQGHTARTTRGTPAPRERQRCGRDWERDARDGRHGEKREAGGTGSPPPPSQPPRPASTLGVKGVPRTRVCARPFPTTCHQQQLPQQGTAQRRVDKLCPA